MTQVQSSSKATAKKEKATSVGRDPSHRFQAPRGTALDIAELNEAEWYEAQRTAIHGMDALDALDPPDTLTGAERDTFRANRRAAFTALRDIGLMAGAMHRLNKAHIETKTSIAPVQDAITDVKKAQRERKAAK